MKQKNEVFIPVLESLKQIPGAAGEQAALPISRLGTTYTMAQEACWVDYDHFAVGRWDGSFSIFNKTTSATQGAVISTAVTTPSFQGVQMIEWIAINTFITSNDDQSMIVWHSPSGTFTDLRQIQKLQFNAAYGVANSATATSLGSTLYLVTGHEAGYLLLWKGNMDGTGLVLMQDVDLRSSNPVNPWGLQNIRGVEWFLSTGSSYIYVATGSENGEVCIVRIPDGTVLSRTVFNPKAQRGINSISVAGQNLLVGNCSVGTADKNLWYYWIDGNDWSVNLRDSVNLIVDSSRPQVFNFNVTWGWYTQGLCFFSATEEGVLWMGTIENNQKLTIFGEQSAAVADLGAALAASISNLVYVAYNVSAFDTYPGAVIDKNANPNRILLPDQQG